MMHKAFWLEFIGKVAAPVFAASLVGCLLADRFEWIHGLLMVAGLGLMGVSHWFEQHR